MKQAKAISLIICISLIITGCSSVSKVDKFSDLVDNKRYIEAKILYSQILKEELRQIGSTELEQLNDFLILKSSDLKDAFIKGEVTYEDVKLQLEELQKFSNVKETIDKDFATVSQVHESLGSFKKGIELISNNRYGEGVTYLRKVIKGDEDYSAAQQELNRVLPIWYNEVLAQADSLAKEGEFDKALNILGQLLGQFGDDPAVKEKREQFQQKAVDSRKQYEKALLAKITSKFDDMQNVTTIVPKGYSTRYVNISRTINIYPTILVTSGNIASFYVTVGFEQDDWVFFDEVIINIDGQLYNWEVGFSDRKTQVLGGGSISEWYSRPELLDDNLIELMSKLANAKQAKIRFSGQGYRDHIVTSAEKANMKTFLELYGYKGNDDDLLKKLNIK